MLLIEFNHCKTRVEVGQLNELIVLRSSRSRLVPHFPSFLQGGDTVLGSLSNEAVILQINEDSHVAFLVARLRIFDVNIVIVNSHHSLRGLFQRRLQDLAKWYHRLTHLTLLATWVLVHDPDS